MKSLLTDERDVAFVLFEQYQVDRLCLYEPFKDFSREVFDMVLRESRKFSEERLVPVNASADREGCRLDADGVKVPKQFHGPWRLFAEGGWIAPCQPEEVGGQGLPDLIGVPCFEHVMAANYAFYTFSGLTRGAARLLLGFGSRDQLEKYMYKMFAGRWAGTMCLTEPQAGSDLSALRTSAKRNADGTFSISGGKIFITDGDHDLTENIVHMVLARIEGAPSGTRGISIFIVPKYRVNADGTIAQSNGVTVSGIERKMGVHASPTCVLNFEPDGACVGELLGEENQGMKIMFHMMNEARIGVGLQGLALASRAYLCAVDYARQRIQGSDISRFRDPDAPKIPIVDHPDVRRMLMYMKSLVEGIRGMIYYGAYCLDMVRIAKTETERRKWNGFLELLTPVIKAYSTDMGFRVVETALQVHGGYGYTKEYPIEQLLRDLKIASIWEGTNGIQAQDLVFRKLGMQQGSVFAEFMETVQAFIASAAKGATLAPELARLQTTKNAVAEIADLFAANRSKDFSLPILYAAPFLDLFGDLIVGWQLLWQATIAEEKLQALCTERGIQTEDQRREFVREHGDASYYTGKIAAAKFFSSAMLTLSPAKAQVIKNGDKAALEIPDACFASI